MKRLITTITIIALFSTFIVGCNDQQKRIADTLEKKDSVAKPEKAFLYIYSLPDFPKGDTILYKGDTIIIRKTFNP